MGYNTNVIGHNTSVIGHNTNVIGHNMNVMGHNTNVIGHNTNVMSQNTTLLVVAIKEQQPVLPIAVLFIKTLKKLKRNACFENGNFAITSCFVVYLFTAGYFYNVFDEVFAYIVNRTAFYYFTGIEIYPMRFVLE